MTSPTHFDTDASAHAEDAIEPDLDQFLDDEERDAGDDGVEESYAVDESALWEGDSGTLDRSERDTVVALMKKAFISSDDRNEWRTLTRSPGPIATALNNVYLKLVIDERAEVAFTQPARTPDEPFKTLVYDTVSSREETLLLIMLRDRHRIASAAGHTAAWVDAEEMHEFVTRFRPPTATDRAGDSRRVSNAIAALATTGLLVRGDDADRYRIHRAIEALLTLDRLGDLVTAFQVALVDDGGGRDEAADTAADEAASSRDLEEQA